MKYFVTILLAATIGLHSFLPGNGIGELSKLPALLEHYQNHQQRDHISFIEFLGLHYANEKHHQQDPQTHHKLPFTDHHSSATGHNFVCFFTERHIQLNTVRQSIGQTNQSIYQSIVEEDITSHVWQPPKLS